jgi:hypothetical protein
LHASGDETDLFVLAELAEITKEVEEEELLSRNAFQQIIHNPENIRKVMLGIVLQVSVDLLLAVNSCIRTLTCLPVRLALLSRSSPSR